MVVFSIKYSVVREIPYWVSPDKQVLVQGTSQRALDWDLWKRGQWAVSSWEGVCWYYLRDLDPEGYKVLLKRFGFDSWEDKFPMEKVVFMSPAELMEARRKREEEQSLPRLEVFTDNIHVEAGEEGLVQHRYPAEIYSAPVYAR